MIDRFAAAVGDWDREAFSRWLEWAETSAEDLTHLLTEPAAAADDDAQPSWTTTVAAIVERALSPSARWPPPEVRVDPAVVCIDKDGLRAAAVDALLARREPVPFREMLVPVVHVARARLAAHADGIVANRDCVSPLGQLSVGAYAALEHDLIERLSSLAAPTIWAEFNRSRPAGLTLLAAFGAGAVTVEEDPREEEYQRFVDRMLDDGLVTLLTQYPVLARLLAVAAELWADATAELLTRLHDDWSALEATFGVLAPSVGGDITDIPPIAAVASIVGGLSDPHRGNRCVIALSFACGVRVVYKPKPLALELRYMELLEWCNAREPALTQRTLRILNRGAYGWSEHIAFEPCQDAAAVTRYYRRAGMHLCLLHALGASDCHAENIIACGEYPVIIDTETFLNAEPPPLDQGDSLPTFDSVLRTGLLPRWECRYDTQTTIDVSGLGFVDGQPSPELGWAHANTDLMRAETVVRRTARLPNVPVVDGVGQPPIAFVAQLVDGYSEMHRLLVAHRDELVAPDGPLAAMRDCETRFVFRPTSVYLALLKGLGPEQLRSGAATWIHCAHVFRAVTRAPMRPAAWPLVGAEMEALTRLDVPVFTVGATATALHDDRAGSPPVPYFARSGYDECTARLAALNDVSLRLQVELIRGAVYSGVASAHVATAERDGVATARRDDGEPVLAADELVAEALELAAELERRAIRSAGDRTDWVGMVYSGRTNRMQVELVGESLFDGRCGIALFLAACWQATVEPTFRDRALDALEPLRRRLRGPETARTAEELVTAIGRGGATGVGSLVYTLVTVGRLIDETALLDDARRLAAALTDEDTSEVDVVKGGAGALLALLALHRATGDEFALAQADAWGRRLMGSRTWMRGADGAASPGVGFAHGTAGIWYALLRLASVTANRQLRADVATGLADEARGTCWQAGDDGHGGAGSEIPRGLARTWCNGLPGIALARLGGLDVLDDAVVRRDLEIALERTAIGDDSGVDHLCCGNLGRVDVLIEASARLREPRLRADAVRLVSRVVQRARRTHGYRLQGELFGATYFDPSFFHGIGGIGYALLRVARPGTLPCVLLWQ
jgi:type 2 lantibiotic biosynthesis protein LanM